MNRNAGGKRGVRNSWVLGCFFWGSLGLLGAETPVGKARSIVNEWVQVESALSAEAIAWEEKKSLLEDLIAVSEADIASLKSQMAEAAAATDAAEQRRGELVKQRDENGALSELVRTFLIGAEARIKGLVPRLPHLLQENLEPLMQRIPREANGSELGIATRMQNVMRVVAEIQRFDMLVATGEEVMATADGVRREVKTVYFGLGAAYYVSADGSDAGVGQAGPSGWEWRSQPELASSVRDAIQLASGKAMEARFLSLPVATQAGDQ